MVNDFGDLDIDADLLESAEEDTLTLSNGCICCTMGTELLYALSDALDRRPRPDCLVIEASGVADPQKIAAAAHAEPEMRYCGVVAMADAANLKSLLADPMIGEQVAAQFRGADLALITKTDLASFRAAADLVRGLCAAPVIEAPRGAVPAELILEPRAADAPGGHSHDHDHDHGAAYRSWSTTGGYLARADLEALLSDPPAGLFRFKGRIALKGGGAVEAHLVGRVHELTPCDAATTRAVAIGLAPAFEPEAFGRRWDRIVSKAP